MDGPRLFCLHTSEVFIKITRQPSRRSCPSRRRGERLQEYNGAHWPCYLVRQKTFQVGFH